ncbi:hypothetical protein CYJ76_11200 [Kytococcus schroeteri]|uniref:Uncharacterized protein n=1 Tax=Kytococcus schroeteri TaxID=138300 RepID=A0A2I1P840_9MICO|nr:hypothetical protein CYJ76_11200 [Kytococcus schroeteri]
MTSPSTTSPSTPPPGLGRRSTDTSPATRLTTSAQCVRCRALAAISSRARNGMVSVGSLPSRSANSRAEP